MVLYLTEQDVDSLLTLDDAIAAVESALREHGEGKAMNRPRQRVLAENTMLHVLPAAVPSAGRLGLKAYTTGPGGARFWTLLFSADGELLAILEADRLGQLRTGAATGVATRYLARPDSRIVAILGSGYQARTQLAAVCKVRPIAQARVWSRTPANAAAFAREMAAQLGIEVVPAPSAREAVRGADVVITITTAREPILFGEWLEPGMHLNVAGSNRASHREVDAAAVARADRIVVDDLAQSQVESGDLIAAVAAGAARWEEMVELGAVVAGRAPGRESPEAITLFKSNGIGLWDVAVAARVYDLARERGVGQPLPISGSPRRVRT
ncbi:MAG: ornithine cyclodeaminase family protein [Bacillota bacterium]